MKIDSIKEGKISIKKIMRISLFCLIVLILDKNIFAQSFKPSDNQKNFIVNTIETAQLKDGKMHINFFPNIFPTTPAGTLIKWKYAVFVQPLEPSNGVYITNLTEEGFDVIENNNGKSNAKFQWILVVYDN